VIAGEVWLGRCYASFASANQVVWQLFSSCQSDLLSGFCQILCQPCCRKPGCLPAVLQLPARSPFMFSARCCASFASANQVVCQLFFQLPARSPVRFSARCCASLASANQVVCHLCFQLPARSPVRFLPDVVPALLVQTRLSASCAPAASQICLQVFCQMLCQLC